MIIILTPEQADIVQGPSIIDHTAMLIPIKLSNGTYALPSLVLDDPAHFNHKDLLSTLPQISIDEFNALILEIE